MNEGHIEHSFVENTLEIYKKLPLRIARQFKNFSEYHYKIGNLFQNDFKAKVLIICFKFKIFGAKEISNFISSNQQSIENTFNDFKRFGIINILIDKERVDRLYRKWKEVYTTSPKIPLFYEINSTYLEKISDYIDMISDYHFDDVAISRIEIRNKRLSMLAKSEIKKVEYFADCVYCGKGITKVDYDNDEFVTYQDKNYHKLCWKTYTTERYM